MKTTLKVQQAPYDYVVQYYEDDLKEREAQPRDPATQFYVEHMRHVTGKSVLNIGCGPQFYDEISYFGNRPGLYAGIDINPSCVNFVVNPTHPRVRQLERMWRLEIEVDIRCGNTLERRKEWFDSFDTVVAVGALGVFDRYQFQQLARLMSQYLRKDGRLVYVDWRQPRIRPSQVAEKIAYRFCGTAEATVEEQVRALHRAGFEHILLERHDVADPREYGWGRIYGHVLDKKFVR